MSLRLIEKQVIYDGRKVRLEVHHLEDDETGGRIRKEVCVHPGAVVILGILPDERIVLIRNRRYTLGGIHLVELPAGTLERNEEPINCAGRELLEETGYLAGRLKPIGAFWASPGILTEKLYAWAAYDLTPQRQSLEADEEIEVVPTPFDEAVAMIGTGEIQDAKTIATLLMYEKFKRGNAE